MPKTIAGKAPPAAADPFRDWLESKPVAELATRCDVSGQTIRNWKRGRPVAPTRVALVKLEAAKDGVVLTTDQLVAVAAG